jgi:hypothetical protein
MVKSVMFDCLTVPSRTPNIWRMVQIIYADMHTKNTGEINSLYRGDDFSLSNQGFRGWAALKGML